MQFKLTLAALIYLTYTALATIVTWNDQLQLWDIGHVDSDPYWPGRPIPDAGHCGHVPDGAYACGSFEFKGIVALRAIYMCADGRLLNDALCEEPLLRNLWSRQNRCVKNQRDKDEQPFAPGMPTDMAVCVEKSAVESG